LEGEAELALGHQVAENSIAVGIVEEWAPWQDGNQWVYKRRSTTRKLAIDDDAAFKHQAFDQSQKPIVREFEELPEVKSSVDLGEVFYSICIELVW